jgi:hypothetical protein
MVRSPDFSFPVFHRAQRAAPLREQSACAGRSRDHMHVGYS